LLTRAPAPPPSQPLSLHDALPISTCKSSLFNNTLQSYRADSHSCLCNGVFSATCCNSRLALIISSIAIFTPISSVRLLTLSDPRSEEHTSELQSREKLVCRLLLEK